MSKIVDKKLDLSNIVDRIIHLFNEKGVSQVVFSRETGISTAYISQVFSGKAKINMEIVVGVISMFPELDCNWLLRGEGEMMKMKKNDVRVVLAGLEAIIVEMIEEKISKMEVEMKKK